MIKSGFREEKVWFREVNLVVQWRIDHRRERPETERLVRRHVQGTQEKGYQLWWWQKSMDRNRAEFHNSSRRKTW